jgi:aarF domain-containing kinase
MDLKRRHLELKQGFGKKQELEDMSAMITMYEQQLADIKKDLTKVSKDIAAVNGDGPVKHHHRAQYLHPIHIRNAKRLRDMCAENGGLYIKLGQHLAMLDHVMPMEYPGILTTLLANTPTSSIESVKRVFQEDLGRSPEELFDTFETIPIASASLAQVHVATKNGQKFAVKVQHEGLVEGSDIDRFVITKIVDVLGDLFSGFRYQWLTKEMNLNLPKELDFQCEKENLLQATKNLQSFIQRGDVAVPKPITDISSKRILTMTFEEGVYVSRIKDISHYQIDASDISTLISRVFSEQIFRHGFVHCDPHEANLLVRPHPKNPRKPQLVLLDHGLYRKLDDQLRKDYARLWQSIILADEKRIEKYCKRLNAGDLYTLLAAVLTLKSWDTVISNDNIDQ